MSSTRPAGSRTPLEGLLRRDRAVVLSALAAVAALSWLYLAGVGAAPGMSDMNHSAGMMSAEPGHWSATAFLLMLLMWAVMMVGMMTPSVAPMILMYARVARHACERGTPFAPTWWFALGYFVAWTGFALAATSLQFGLERASLLSPMVAKATPEVGATILLVAGLYQWTSLKTACLSECQSPFLFIQRHGGFRGERGAAVVLGLRHGAYCVGCCWALMALLFVFGVMNLLWIAALGALVLVEKLISGRLIQRAIGLALVIAGVGLLAG